MISTLLFASIETDILNKTVDIYFTDYKVISKKKIKSKLEPFNPQKGEKIFITKGCCLPRVKIKNYYDNQGFNVSNTNDIDKADCCIIGQDTFQEYLSYRWFYLAKTNDFIEVLQQIKDLDYEIRMDEEVFDSYNLSSILVNSTFNADMDNIIPNYEYKELDYKRLEYINNSDEDFFNSLYEKKLISESEILKNINGDDAAVIDKERYEVLSNMLSSSDEDNITLAMEIMANSHYSKSIIYLNLLFYKYASTIDNTGKHKRHVNFKSLLRYMSLTPSDLHIGCEEVIKNLYSRDKLDTDNLNIYCKEFIESLSLRDGHSYYGGSLNFVKINEIVLDHELVKKALGNSFTYKIENNGN